MFYRNHECVKGRTAIDEYQVQRPLEFQAKCVVVLIEESSRKALMDSLIRAGRRLDTPLRISFNFSTSKSPNPDLDVSSMNCGLGELMLENYKRDAVGQQVQLELRRLREALDTKSKQVELFDRTTRGLSGETSTNLRIQPHPSSYIPYSASVPPVGKVAELYVDASSWAVVM
jgi:hypothetical protein